MNHKQLHNKEELEVKIYTPRYQALQQQSPTNLFQDHAPVRISAADQIQTVRIQTTERFLLSVTHIGPVPLNRSIFSDKRNNIHIIRSWYDLLQNRDVPKYADSVHSNRNS